MSIDELVKKAPFELREFIEGKSIEEIYETAPVEWLVWMFMECNPNHRKGYAIGARACMLAEDYHTTIIREYLVMAYGYGEGLHRDKKYMNVTRDYIMNVWPDRALLNYHGNSLHDPRPRNIVQHGINKAVGLTFLNKPYDAVFEVLKALNEAESGEWDVRNRYVLRGRITEIIPLKLWRIE